MMREEETVCPYCGVGCGINITISDGVPTKVRGVKDHLVSRGHLCAKGFAALDILRSKDRLTHPIPVGTTETNFAIEVTRKGTYTIAWTVTDITLQPLTWGIITLEVA